MPWGRAILAALAVLLVVGGGGSLIVMGAGGMRPDFAATPGLNPQDVAALSAPYEDLRQGRDADVLSRLTETSEGAQAEIDRIQGLLPAGQPTSSRLTTFNITTGTSGNQLWGVREYEYPDHVVRAETTLYRATGSEPWGIRGLHVNVATREEVAANAFNFAAEPRDVQAVIAAAVVVPLFTLITFLVALFRPGVKPRWAWALAAAFGFGTIYANTGTDVLSFAPLSFQLFGAGAIWSGSAFDGWMFSASTPFGALAFWLLAKRAAKTED